MRLLIQLLYTLYYQILCILYYNHIFPLTECTRHRVYITIESNVTITQKFFLLLTQCTHTLIRGLSLLCE